MNEPLFLSLAEVLHLHARALAEFGGGLGVRSQALLESALAMPAASFGGIFVHPDIFAMASAYAFHISQNQPFLDGNKRTGLLAALVFLELNGVRIEDPEDKLYDCMIAIGEHRQGKEDVARLLSSLVVPVRG